MLVSVANKKSGVDLCAGDSWVEKNIVKSYKNVLRRRGRGSIS